MSARNTVVRTTSANDKPAGLEDRADVVEHPPRLNRDVAADQSAGGGIERNLPGEEEQVAGANRLRVRSRPGLGACGRRNGVVWSRPTVTVAYCAP